MGGERETTVCASKATSKDTTVLGDIRIHEAKGEVHFHADSSGLKVAVPCGVWFQAWTRLMNEGGIFNYIDPKRNTIIQVDTIVDGAKIDAKVSINTIEIGDTFKALQEFTIGK